MHAYTCTHMHMCIHTYTCTSMYEHIYVQYVCMEFLFPFLTLVVSNILNVENTELFPKLPSPWEGI